jgi:hypothetical protein
MLKLPLFYRNLYLPKAKDGRKLSKIARRITNRQQPFATMEIELELI